MITHNTKVGDDVEYNGEKGKVTGIMGEQGKVAVVEIPVTSMKTVYVAIPEPPEASPVESPIIEN